MHAAIRKIRTALLVASRGERGQFRQILSKQLFSDSIAYGLRRDLTVSREPPAPRIDLHVRPVRPEDLAVLFDATGLSPAAARELADRKRLLFLGIPTCWVAATLDEKPCFMQWLFSPRVNEDLRKHFDGLFPPLAADEGLIEDAYTVRSRRGIGIMPWATARITEKASEFGARWVLGFTDAGNSASLKASLAAGFVPYLLRRERWRLFRHSVTFAPLPPDFQLPIAARAKAGTPAGGDVAEVSLSGPRSDA